MLLQRGGNRASDDLTGRKGNREDIIRTRLQIYDKKENTAAAKLWNWFF